MLFRSLGGGARPLPLRELARRLGNMGWSVALTSQGALCTSLILSQASLRPETFRTHVRTRQLFYATQVSSDCYVVGLFAQIRYKIFKNKRCCTHICAYREFSNTNLEPFFSLFFTTRNRVIKMAVLTS